MTDYKYDVCGLGNALVDALVEIDDDSVLDELELTRGTMHLVDDARWQRAFSRVRHGTVEIHPGGSCANTITGLALLGARTTFCGQVGDDALGRQYASRIDEAMGGHHLRVHPEHPTGKCLALISVADAQRTMLTDLGASPILGPEHVFVEAIAQSRYLHLEGYLFTGPPIRDAAWKALDAAKAAGTRVSFDVSDPWVVSAFKEDVLRVMREYAQVVFLNEEEARALTGLPADAAVKEVASQVEIAVVKRGSRGSLVMRGERLVEVPVNRVEARDTTGAGDAYAAGFLFGLVKGFSMEGCGELGSRLAAKTVAQVGAVVRDPGFLEELRARVAGWGEARA